VQDVSAERWKPIPCLPGYEASDLGRIRSLDRTVICKNGRAMRLKGRMLRLRKNTGGHLIIGSGKQGTFSVHTLVLEAFIGPRPEGQEACHYNDIKTDNRLANLRWDTRKANAADRRRNGINERLNRTHCPRQHPLADPNLVPHLKRIDRRSCLACALTWRSAVKARKRGEEFDFKAVSDGFYAEILGRSEQSA
jgi:hypothetical protein